MSGSSGWKIMSSLPTNGYGVQVVTYDNILLTFGNASCPFSNLYTITLGGRSTENIYQFNSSSGTWTLFGNMKYEHGHNAVDLVDHDEFSKFCK